MLLSIFLLAQLLTDILGLLLYTDRQMHQVQVGQQLLKILFQELRILL